MPTLKHKLANETSRLHLPLCVIGSPVVAQALAASGSDGIIIDLEHGAIGPVEAQAMIAATAGTDCAPLVRVPDLSPVSAKRALDLGAEGLVFPLINTAEEAAEAAAMLQYPPNGTRSFGPMVAAPRYGTDMAGYSADFGSRAICCLLAETAEAARNIEAICATPGIDLIVVAPYDLSTSLGRPGDFDSPDFKAAFARIEDAVLAADIPLGSIALTEEVATAQFARGHRVMLTVDTLTLSAAAREARRWCDAP